MAHFRYKLRVHFSVRAWPPCCTTPPSSPPSCVRVRVRVCEMISFHSMFILFSLVTFINTKGSIFLEEFLMLLMDGNFNPFAISNKQAHSISGNLPELRYGELGFSLTQVSR